MLQITAPDTHTGTSARPCPPPPGSHSECQKKRLHARLADPPPPDRIQWVKKKLQAYPNPPLDCSRNVSKQFSDPLDRIGRAKSKGCRPPTDPPVALEGLGKKGCRPTPQTLWIALEGVKTGCRLPLPAGPQDCLLSDKKGS